MASSRGQREPFPDLVIAIDVTTYTGGLCPLPSAGGLALEEGLADLRLAGEYLLVTTAQSSFS